MAFADLRLFIDAAAAIGEVKKIDGAHWDLEIGCLTELMAERDGPLLFFDNIPGYPKGFRIATNVLALPRLRRGQEPPHAMDHRSQTRQTDRQQVLAIEARLPGRHRPWLRAGDLDGGAIGFQSRCQ